jgi:hypothetical protein
MEYIDINQIHYYFPFFLLPSIFAICFYLLITSQILEK